MEIFSCVFLTTNKMNPALVAAAFSTDATVDFIAGKKKGIVLSHALVELIDAEGGL